MTVTDEIAEKNVRDIVSIFSAVGGEESRAMLRQAAGTDALMPQIPATQKAWKERAKAWSEIADSFSDLVAEDNMVISRRGIDEEVMFDHAGRIVSDGDDEGAPTTDVEPAALEKPRPEQRPMTESFTLGEIAQLLQSSLVTHGCHPNAGLWFYFVSKIATTEKSSDGTGLKRRLRCYFGVTNLERVGGWYLEHFRRSRAPVVIVPDEASSAGDSTDTEDVAPEEKDNPQKPEGGAEEFLIHTAGQRDRLFEIGAMPRDDDADREIEASKPTDELIQNVMSGQFQKVLEGKEKSHAAKAMKKERDRAIKAGHMEKPPRDAKKPHQEKRENRFKTQVSVSDSSAHSITDLERKFDGLTSRVSALEMRVTGVEVRMTSVETKLDVVIALLQQLVGDQQIQGIGLGIQPQQPTSQSTSASSSSQLPDFTVPPLPNTPRAKAVWKPKAVVPAPAKTAPSVQSDTDVSTPRVKKAPVSAKASSSKSQKGDDVGTQPAPKSKTKRSGPPGGYTKGIAAVTEKNVDYKFAHFKFPEVVVIADKDVYPHLSNPDIITERRARAAFAKASKRRFAQRSLTDQKTFGPKQAYDETLKVLRIVDNVVREECQ